MKYLVIDYEHNILPFEKVNDVVRVPISRDNIDPKYVFVEQHYQDVFCHDIAENGYSYKKHE